MSRCYMSLVIAMVVAVDTSPTPALPLTVLGVRGGGRTDNH